jgi:arylsulfatase A-like enzyme
VDAGEVSSGRAGITPKNVALFLFDSLNRHMLGAYGGAEFPTPNFDRFAARAVRFDSHYAGSLPCMPARHDILCGAWDFLWRPWGSVELWEDGLAYPLSKEGVVSQLITDHPHLFETGGENYHADFTAWDYQRGHEGDAWKTEHDPSWAGAPLMGRKAMPYDRSRPHFGTEADFPGPRTMAAAARWLERNAGQHERFFLFVDEFDPHEPFDTPDHWAKRTDPDWDGPPLIWPPYGKDVVKRGVISAREARQVRARYGAKLMMIDHWFGQVLDRFDALNLWDDTLLIVTTDHGHYLGERDIFGKPGVPLYQPIAHIPLMMAGAGLHARAEKALTTSVDLHATVVEAFGAQGHVRQRTHGKSLLPLLSGATAPVRDHVLAGVWGREVHLIDGRMKLARAPVGPNAPLPMLSNRWSTMPTHFLKREQELPLPDARAVLSRMPGSDVPVLHQTFEDGDKVPFWAWASFSGDHCYDLAADPEETNNLAGSEAAAAMTSRLAEALAAVEAPAEQYRRLGLSLS